MMMMMMMMIVITVTAPCTLFTCTTAKYLTCFVPFKPINNIVRQVLHCPILQMKTLRLRRTGNSFPKTCSQSHCCIPLICSTLDFSFWTCKIAGYIPGEVISKGACDTRIPDFQTRTQSSKGDRKHHLFPRYQRLVPSLQVQVNNLSSFPSSLHEEWLRTQKWFQRQRWPKFGNPECWAFPEAHIESFPPLLRILDEISYLENKVQIPQYSGGGSLGSNLNLRC